MLRGKGGCMEKWQKILKKQYCTRKVEYGKFWKLVIAAYVGNMG